MVEGGREWSREGRWERKRTEKGEGMTRSRRNKERKVEKRLFEALQKNL